MANFKIEWENEMEADTPLEVVKEGLLDIQKGYALRFTVTNLKTGQRWSVDLNEADEDAVCEIAE